MLRWQNKQLEYYYVLFSEMSKRNILPDYKVIGIVGCITKCC